MQRIRDESHRFANGYNELLLRKRIRESLLDDCPGMTPRKKQLLLARFSTVAEIKKTSPQTLATIKGISIAWASKILDWLNQ
ncbi:MAG: hypothetical protein RR889_01385 [Akkermansia sp.]